MPTLTQTFFDNLKPTDFKTIIFDLGGVIIGLDWDASFKAFAQLAGKTHEEVNALHQKHLPFFYDYECGRISDEAFRQGLRSMLEKPELTAEALDNAWNAMLGDIPPHRPETLRTLRKQGYRVYILSNTNDIHIRGVYKILQAQTGLADFEGVSDHVFLSQQMGQRKPDTEIFETVLQHGGLVPQECLFLDDSPANLEGAQATGIKTLHVTHPDVVQNFFGV